MLPAAGHTFGVHGTFALSLVCVVLHVCPWHVCRIPTPVQLRTPRLVACRDSPSLTVCTPIWQQMVVAAAPVALRPYSGCCNAVAACARDEVGLACRATGRWSAAHVCKSAWTAPAGVVLLLLPEMSVVHDPVELHVCFVRGDSFC